MSSHTNVLFIAPDYRGGRYSYCDDGVAIKSDGSHVVKWRVSNGKVEWYIQASSKWRVDNPLVQEAYRKYLATLILAPVEDSP